MNSIQNSNNEAVSFMLRGEDEQAISTLRMALCPLLRSEELRTRLLGSNHHGAAGLQQDHRRREDGQAPQHQGYGTISNDSSAQLYSGNDGYFRIEFVDVESFEQDGTSEQALQISDKSNILCYAIISYNLASMLHIEAIRLGVSSMFPKVLTLYSLSIRLLHAAYSTEEISRMEETSHMYLALLNNMGDAYQQLVLEQQASVCFEQMRVFLANLSQRDETIIDRFRFFATNSVSSQYEFPPSPAPAA